MITVTIAAEDGRSLIQGGEELLSHPGLKWIDLDQPTEEGLLPLAERFKIHRLVVEDCLHLDQRPKLEEYPEHHFLVLHGFTAPPEEPCELTLHEVHFIIGKDFVITVHEKAHPAISEARRRLQADTGNSFRRGPDFIVYVIADALVDSNFPLLDSLNDSIETLEEKVFEKPDQRQLETMFTVKRALLTLRRTLSPQRDVLSLLVRGGGFVQERTALYFRDVYDHLIRIHEQIEAARDLLGNARDSYLSMVANRTNDITKQLTIFATIFLPLSFITGFFGQNFEVLSGPAYFWIMMISVALLPVLLMAWFRYKRWI